jgi:anti-anti-sigma regulatory factor
MTGLASAAMGLQNATITHISSGLVRTTHVTGVLTDLGHEAVQFIWWLRDARRNVPPGSSRALLHSVYAHPTAQRLVMLGSIFVTFALGAGLGTFAFGHTVHWVMFPPVAFLVWIIYQDITRPIAEIEPSTLIGAGKGMDLPESLAVFHLRKDHDRQGHVHRMPNLLDWAGRLPGKTRVVILDLAEVTQLDENAALELQAVLGQFAAQERTLIISGLNAEQFQQINGMGEKQLLEPEDVCTDLELAIARGLNRLEGLGVQ